MDVPLEADHAVPVRGAGRSFALRSCLAGAALVLGACVLEFLLHLFPAWLPAAFRDGYPLHGIEFYQPGVLAGCPLDAFPLPLVSVPWDGPPPADLKDYGVAPPDDERDALRFPRVVTPSDERGLPNARGLERAAVVVVGDSFVLSASSTEPPGLVRELAGALERSVYSLGVAGIGPQQERWLLENVGLALEPELVLWCFFGGNDLSDAKILLERQGAGLQNRAELPTHRRLPTFYLPELIAWRFADRSPNPAPASQALPSFLLPATSARTPRHETWLHPAYLVRCSIARADWEQHVAWQAATDEILAARGATERQGSKFVLVYLPSKSEALLPALAMQPELLHRYLSHDLEGELPLAPARARDLLLAQRAGLEEALAAFCGEAGIPFFSATEVLERQALGGVAGFLSTDTHWAPEGEAVVLGALLSFLRRNDLAPR